MPRTAIGAFYAMMRASYWKRASRNSASTPSRRDRRCAAFPAHADEVVAWSESGPSETCQQSVTTSAAQREPELGGLAAKLGVTGRRA